MKALLTTLMLAAVLLVGIISCSENDGVDIAEVSEVAALYAPEDNASLNLSTPNSVVFEWQPSKSADNGVVLYDVAFDREDGDFSDPVYVTPSDGRGIQNTLTLDFSDLNRIAEMAGIASKSVGKLKWSVWSSKGLDVKQSPVSRIIEVERSGGFPTPDELFITGEASEAGADVANALPLVKTGPTTYEIYTRLTPGTYRFVSQRSEEAEAFYIDGADLKADGATTYSGEDEVKRIRLDFSDGSVAMTTVENVELWFPPLGEFLFSLNYAGNGTWEALDQPIAFKEESWGRDERYKFKFTLSQDGESSEEWYGSVNADNQRPDQATEDSYWNLVSVTDDEWANTFKFATEVDGANADIRIYYNADVPEYTHEVSVL